MSIEKGRNLLELSENYSTSYISGPSRGGFLDESNLSAFHPLAVSTSTKWSPDATTAALLGHPNRYRLSVSSFMSSENGDGITENQPDSSSLGLLHTSHMQSLLGSADSTPKKDDNDSFELKSFGAQDEMPNFSDEFNGKGGENNLDFIENEQAQNKADHPFIQEEVIDNANQCDTTSWSVSRELESIDERPRYLHTSDNNEVSVSAFFKRRSGPLGRFEEDESNGSASPCTMIFRKPGISSPSIDQRRTNENVNPENEAAAACKELPKPLLPIQENAANRPSRSLNRRTEETAKPRLIAKPPRAPLKAQVTSPNSISMVKNQTPNLTDISLRDVTNQSSFLSLSTIQDYVLNASPSKNGSFLAKEILSLNETAKMKKGKSKSEKSRTVQTNAVNEINAPPLSKREPVDISKTVATVGRDVSEEKNDGPETGSKNHSFENKQTNIETVSANSITVAMEVNGILYKGVLYAQSVASTAVSDHS